MAKLPENIDAEKAVIAHLIREPASLVDVSTHISAEDFAAKNNAAVYTALLELSRTNTDRVTPILLIEHLREAGQLNEAGGQPYIATIGKQPDYTKDQTLEHAKVIAKTAKLRQGREVMDEAYKELIGAESKDGQTILSAGQRMLDIAQRTRSYRAVTPDQGYHEVIDQIHKSIDRKGELLGISTGFRGLDTMMYGFEPSKLYVLAARPGVGKTAFLLNLADHIALNMNIPTLFLSLEMASDELYMRMFCSRARVDSSIIKLGNAGPQTLQLIEEAAAKTKGAKLEVDDIPTRTIDEIRLRASRFIRTLPESSPAIIMVDYLQLLSAEVRRSESREREVAKVSVGLKAMSKELNIPVLTAAQLRRAKDKSRPPTLEDLRESGAIEQDADVVMFLHKVQDKDEESGEKEGRADFDNKEVKLIVAKNRAGRLGEKAMEFEAHFTRFKEKYESGKTGSNTFDNIFE